MDESMIESLMPMKTFLSRDFRLILSLDFVTIFIHDISRAVVFDIVCRG